MDYKASTPWLYLMTLIKWYNPPLLMCNVQSDITVYYANGVTVIYLVDGGLIIFIFSTNGPNVVGCVM